MDYLVRNLPTRDVLEQVQKRELFEADASGIDLVLNLIAAADLIRTNIYGRLAKSYNISEGKFTLLMALLAEGDLGSSELASKIGVTPATISVMVKRMLADPAPLISVSKTHEDGRSRNLSLTSAGEKLVRQALPEHFYAIQKFAEVLDQDERDSLILMLRKLMRKLP